MFKFTIRELLLLTLIIGVSLAWGIRERQSQLRIRQLQSDVQRWRLRTGTMAYVLIERDCKLKWTETSVEVVGPPPFKWRQYETDRIEPSEESPYLLRSDNGTWVDLTPSDDSRTSKP